MEAFFIALDYVLAVDYTKGGCMIEVIQAWFDFIIGSDTPLLNIYQTILRAIIIYIIAVLLVRIGKKRFLARPSSFDIVLLLIFGSVISRAITGNAPFIPTIGAALVLIGLHVFFSVITFYSSRFGALIKGYAIVLIKDGEIQWNEMKTSRITERDLLSALRRNAQILDPRQVKLAMLERNGEISVIPKPRRPYLVEVAVKDEVQTIKIEIR